MATEDLFFSTTDRRGVIEQCNCVFVRISGYSRDELAGKPHNIVRHPDMPGGAFRWIWDRLAAGRSAGAYVKNRAKDGSAYWVFAVLSPVPSGYLSVRMAPRGPLFDVVRQVYAEAVAAEREAVRTRGTGRRDAAGLGLAAIETALGRHGFASLDAFALDALPAEVSARRHLVTTAFARPAHGVIGEVLGGAGALDELLGGLVDRLTAYQNLCDRLAATSSTVLDITERLAGSVAAAQHASELVADSAPTLANVARVMAAPMGDAGAALSRLGARLGRLRTDVAELRFRISLARVYNDMVAAFAAEVIDNAAPPDSLHAVPLLCHAAQAGFLEMSEQVRRVNEELRQSADLVAEAGELLETFRRFLGQWRNLVFRSRSDSSLRDELATIDAEITASWDWMDMLRSLGREYRSAVIPFDAGLLGAHLDKMRGALGTSAPLSTG
ncbi:PAS domain-containing protein [Actinomadura sp. NBRC 104425]|uniref:PAS domain-containing protein n=1 Tax=Actinomadura sp. NBRC 104425 TaxID=3032204 RepID=UPI0025523132|nr:PAS domain-containing protein [Actinomadura sp. NBRC 104425]